MSRIAIVQRFLPPVSRGGVGHFAHGLATVLSSRGHAVTMFSEDPGPPGAPYEVRRVTRANATPRTRRNPLGFALRVGRLDFSAFDLIHAQGDDQFIPRRSAPPVVRTLHGSSWAEAIHNGVYRLSPRRFLLHFTFYALELVSDLRADTVVAVSRHTGRHFLRLDEVVPNGVDLGRFAPDDAPKAPQPTILFVGELRSRKRGDLLVDVVRRFVRPQVPDVRLWVVSPDRVDGEGIEWWGAVDDERLAGLYRSAWVMCLPSSYEGFGRPYIEAMAAGTAVIATPNPGAQEALDDGRAGLIVKKHDLGPALCRLLTNADARRTLAARGLERSREFAWDRVAVRYELIYEAVLERRAHHPAV